MKQIIEYSWKAIKEECEKFQEKDCNIKFNDDRFSEYDKNFREQYKSIMERFMKETRELDSHKQAAIIVTSVLHSQVIEHSVEEDNISIVPQLIALNVALSYMLDRLNEKLKKKHLKKIEEYKLPVAIACETPYVEIMSRILYYEQNEKDMSFNVLELADRFFLIEYINLLENNIEPCILRED